MDSRNLINLREKKELHDVILMLNGINFANAVDKIKMVDMLDEYIQNIYIICDGMSSQERLITILLKRMSIYYCIMLTKIFYASDDDDLHISMSEGTDKPSKREKDKSKKYVYTDHPVTHYLESRSSTTTPQLYFKRRINDIEFYMKWFMKAVKMTEVDVITTTILMKHICESNNNALYKWFQKKYDMLIVVILIVARKLYGVDHAYYNYYYSRMFKMNILEINAIEIALILHINMTITEREHDEYLGELYLEYINRVP